MNGGGGFFGGTIGRPVALAMLLVTLLLVGVIAYLRIPLQLIPSGLDSPNVWVFIPSPGGSARENEEKVARPIEEELRTLAGVTRVRSWSSEGFVRLGIAFDPNLDLDLAKAEVRDRIERVRPRLPAGVDRFSFWSEDADQLPLASVGILHGGDSDRTDFLVQQVVVPRLESMSGIAKVDIFGDLADSVRILLDEQRVMAAGISIGELITRLSREVGTVPLGEVDDGDRRFLLRADLRPGGVEALENYPIRRGLTIGDVGEVVRAKSVRQSLTRIDGAYSYFAIVRKDAQANVVEASRALRSALAELESDPRIAGELRFQPFFVQGDLIENSLDQLARTALWGGLLAVVVLLVFLRRIRLTLCVALALPISVVVTIAFEYFAGRSFNLLTMTGITLALGMLVDNAVVVVENIARLRAEGLSKRDAAERGARDIALAVTLATLTTVVVFVPLIFMGENPQARTMLEGLGLPLCIALLASLVVALVFLPAVAARLLGDRPALVERAGRWLEPVAAVPALGASVVARAAARVADAGLRAVHLVNRALLAVLAPRARWVAKIATGARVAVALALVASAAVWRAGKAQEVAARADWSSLELPPADFTAALAAMGGPARELVLALPVLAALLVGVALVFLPPWLAARVAPPPRRAPRGPLERSMVSLVTGALTRLAKWSLAHRFASAVISGACLASIAIPMSRLDAAALGEGGGGDAIRYYVEFESDFTLAEAAAEIALHEQAVEGWREELGFSSWMTRFDERSGRVSLFWDVPPPPSVRRQHERRVKELAPRPVGHAVRFEDDSQSGPSRTLLTFVIGGQESRELERLAREGTEVLRAVPGLRNVRSALEQAPRQIELRVDRDTAHSFGVDSTRAFQSVAWTLRGWPLPRFWDDDREVPLYIEFDQKRAAGLDTLRDLTVWGDAGPVALASFTEVAFERGSREVYRDRGRTTVTIQAEIDDPLRALELERAGYLALGQLEMPRGYVLGGEDSLSARQEAEFSSLLRALVLSLVLVFLVMGVLFESVSLPFSVLVSVPFAFLGAIWTMSMTGTPMDVMGWIGLIVLAGVVVNNGIVLIDRIHRLRAEGVERGLAVVQGVRDRVRPVLMTAGTTVMGLLPMALAEPASDAIDYRALATIVGGGLVSSTFFTLWLVPLAYTGIDDLGRAVSRAARRGWRRAFPSPAASTAAARLSA